MTPDNTSPASLEFHPLTPERWADFEALFGPHGAYSGCWCMWWRVKHSDFERQQGDGNREAMRAIVHAGEVPGILAYRDGEPAGWCSVAPRESFPVLERSRVLKRVDDRPVWSIVCFYVGKPHRNRGMTVALIRAAVDYVRRQGGKVVEAYPTEPGGRNLAPVSVYMGLPAAFRKAGFVEVARPSARKVIMRYTLESPP